MIGRTGSDCRMIDFKMSLDYKKHCQFSGTVVEGNKGNATALHANRGVTCIHILGFQGIHAN